MKENIFTTDGSGSYPFSTIVTDGDYDRSLTRTEWDRTNRRAIQIVTAAEWQLLKSGIISNAGIYRWGRERGGDLIMTPDAAGSELVFEYVSNFYVIALDGTKKASFTADTDTAVWAEDLLEIGTKYRIKKEAGLPADDDEDDYNDLAENLIAQEKPAKVLTPNDSVFRSRYIVNIPDSGAGS